MPFDYEGIMLMIYLLCGAGLITLVLTLFDEGLVGSDPSNRNGQGNQPPKKDRK